MKFQIKVGKLDISYEDLEMDLDVRALVRAMNMRSFVVDTDTDEIDEVTEAERSPQETDKLQEGYQRFQELMEDWARDWEDSDPTVIMGRSALIKNGVHGSIIRYINAAGGLTQAAWVVMKEKGHTKEEVTEYVGALVQTASVMYPPLSETWIPGDIKETPNV